MSDAPTSRTPQHSAQKFECKKEPGLENKKIVGIDLGTTFSSVGIWKNDDVEIRPNSEGQRTTPSIVSYIFEDGRREPAQILVGPSAKRKQINNFKGTIYDSKRMLGKAFDDPTLQGYIRKQIWQFDVQKDEKNRPIIKFWGFSVSPVDVSAEILRAMKDIARKGLHCDEFDQVVVAHPAYFDNAQKSETKEAAIRAGFKHVEMISEPLAAALAYGVLNRHFNGNVVVFDLGGGTFDVSIIEIKEGKMEVKSLDGSSEIGGRDFDNILFEMVRFKIKNAGGMDILRMQNKRPCHRIRQKCEEIKIALSGSIQECIYLEEFYPEMEDQKIVITRKEFEDNCRTLIMRTLEITERAYKKSSLDLEQINEVLLVGGSSRIPIIKQLLRRMFGKSLNESLNPEEAVCYGATVRAAQLDGKEKVPQIELIDVIPLSLGIDTEDGRFIEMIPRNTKVPFKMSQKFYTSENDQRGMTFAIFEGESPIANDNRYLGQIVMPSLELGCAGFVSVELTLELDKNGLLRAKASHRPRHDTAQDVDVEMEIDYEGRRANDAVAGQMLRGVEARRDVNERNRSILEATEALDMEIKRVQYGIQTCDVIPAKKEAWTKNVLNPIIGWLSEHRGRASVRELGQQRLRLKYLAKREKIPRHTRPRGAEPIRRSEREKKPRTNNEPLKLYRDMKVLHMNRPDWRQHGREHGWHMRSAVGKTAAGFERYAENIERNEDAPIHDRLRAREKFGFGEGPSNKEDAFGFGGGFGAPNPNRK